VPADFRQKYPDVDWRAMTGMRDILIHKYFGIDYDIVWDVISQAIPRLHGQIEEIIQREAGDPDR
jgi:uncharacterized protein with HEPN domain